MLCFFSCACIVFWLLHVCFVCRVQVALGTRFLSLSSCSFYLCVFGWLFYFFLSFSVHLSFCVCECVFARVHVFMCEYVHACICV